jgi:hypothetical protein
VFRAGPVSFDRGPGHGQTRRLDDVTTRGVLLAPLLL